MCVCVVPARAFLRIVRMSPGVVVRLAHRVVFHAKQRGAELRRGRNDGRRRREGAERHRRRRAGATAVDGGGRRHGGGGGGGGRVVIGTRRPLFGPAAVEAEAADVQAGLRTEARLRSEAATLTRRTGPLSKIEARERTTGDAGITTDPASFIFGVSVASGIRLDLQWKLCTHNTVVIVPSGPWGTV